VPVGQPAQVASEVVVAAPVWYWPTPQIVAGEHAGKVLAAALNVPCGQVAQVRSTELEPAATE